MLNRTEIYLNENKEFLTENLLIMLVNRVILTLGAASQHECIMEL